MRILVVNGSLVQITRHELLQLMRHKYFVGFFLAVLLLVMALKPFAEFYDMDVMTMTLLFIPGVCVYLTIYFGGALLMDSVGIRPTTFLLLPIAAFSTSSTVVFLGQVLQLGTIDVRDLVALYVFHLVVFFVGELTFVLFLLPACLKEIRSGADEGAAKQPTAVAGQPRQVDRPTGTQGDAEQPAALPQEIVISPTVECPQMLTLFGHRFDRSDVWAIRAVEHYIEVKTRAGEYRLLRGRMSEAEQALPPDLGFRVHRSHWVSAQALKMLDQRRDRWQIHLHCGTEVPVARARREETRAWVSAVMGPQDQALK